MFQVGSEYELRAGAASVLDNINRWADILTNIINRWADIYRNSFNRRVDTVYF
jgi:hypothetical protein